MVARAVRSAALPETIYHSGKARARQTAEIIAKAIQPTPAVVPMEGLGPNDDPTLAHRSIGQWDKPVMLVGHLPHLARLAALLVTGHAERPLIAFRMGGVVCLRLDDRGDWVVDWVVTPDVAGRE